MKINIGEVIKNLRKEKGISQEMLAEKMGVSIQAVSKWECDNSYPDIILLPQIAEYFAVSIDCLIYGKDSDIRGVNNTIPDDDKLRIVQYRGNRILSKDDYDPSVHIMLKLEDKLENYKPVMNVEVWGSVDIQGDIYGGVNAGDSITCGNINGGVNAGESISCGNIGGGVNAGNSVNCGNIGGGVNAGESVQCGNVGGGVDAGNSIKCGNVDGSVNSGESVNCGDIYGNIESCSGDVHCRQINGDVHCDGDIIYENR